MEIVCPRQIYEAQKRHEMTISGSRRHCFLHVGYFEINNFSFGKILTPFSAFQTPHAGIKYGKTDSSREFAHSRLKRHTPCLGIRWISWQQEQPRAQNDTPSTKPSNSSQPSPIS